MPQDDDLKLVSFDAGGPRLLSALEILRILMHRIKWDKYPNDDEKVMLPCEYFDMMGGTDTGGLIVVMLVKLRMSAEEALAAFETIAAEVYAKGLEPTERTARLRKCVESLLNKRGLSLDAKLEGTRQEGGCLGFTLASPRVNVGHKVYFRTYLARHQPPSGITIVDAVLATCASQPEFLAASIGSGFGKREYVSSDLCASNPVRQVIAEAYSHFEGVPNIGLLLSLGSGHPGIVSLSPNGGSDMLHHLMQGLLVDSQQRAQEIQEKMDRVGTYFRFSVEQGMQRNQPVDSEELEWIAAQTDSYLAGPDISRRIDECVERLSTQLGLVPLNQPGRSINSPDQVVTESHSSELQALLLEFAEKLRIVGGEKAQIFDQREYESNMSNDQISSYTVNRDHNSVIGYSGLPKAALDSRMQERSDPEKSPRKKLTLLLNPPSTSELKSPLSRDQAPLTQCGKEHAAIPGPIPVVACPVFVPQIDPSNLGPNSSHTKGKSRIPNQPIGQRRKSEQHTTNGYLPPLLRNERLGHSSRAIKLAELDDMERNAWYLYNQCRYFDAESLQVKILETWLTHAGDEDPRTLRYMFSLATTYYQLKLYSKAGHLFHRVWEGRRLTLGETNEETIDAMCNLAWTYYQDGRYMEAEPLFSRVRKVRTELEQAHTMALVSMSDLALILFQQRRYQETGIIQEQLLRSRKAWTGNESKETIDAMCDLAWTYYEQGRESEAQDLWKQVQAQDAK